MWLQGVKGCFKRSQGLTRGNRGLKGLRGVKRGHTRLQGFLSGYKGLEGLTGGCKRL